MRTYHFEKDSNVYLITTTKNYVVTNWSRKGIYLLDKNLKTIEHILVQENIVINQFFTDYEGCRIALFCPRNARIFIINLLSKQVHTINIKISLDEEALLFSPLYYWTQDTLLIQLYDQYYLQVCARKNQATQIKQDDIRSRAPDFYSFFSKVEKQKQNVHQTIYAFPQKNQITYQDIKERKVGFIDYNNATHLTFDYKGDDIHQLYFVNDTFIIVKCSSIEALTRWDKKVLLQSKESSEFRNSVYDQDTKIMYVLSRYWKGSEQKITLYSLKL